MIIYLKKFVHVHYSNPYFYRLTPAYAIVVGFYATLMVYLGSGPGWNQHVKQQSEWCRENWLFNFLYLNNYIGYKNMVNFILISVNVLLLLYIPLTFFCSLFSVHGPIMVFIRWHAALCHSSIPCLSIVEMAKTRKTDFRFIHVYFNNHTFLNNTCL